MIAATWCLLAVALVGVNADDSDDTVVFGRIAGNTAPAWCYDNKVENVPGPDKWAERYPQCADNGLQSPIDIPIDAPEKVFPIRKVVNWNSTVTEIFYNNGRNPRLVFGSAERSPYIIGGALPNTEDKYFYNYMEFFVGDDDTSGSAHTFGGKSCPLELVIHSFKNGLTKEADDSAAVSIFYEIAEEDNPALQPFLDGLKQISVFDRLTSVVFKDLLEALIPVANHATYGQDYYTYQGSLLSPPCSPSVTWILLNQRTPISKKQLAVFRELKSEMGLPLVNKRRPLQAKGTREVFKSVPGKATPWG